MTAPVLISIKTPTGLAVGQAVQVSPEALIADIHGSLPVGQPLEFRLELPGADETVRGTLCLRSSASDRHHADILSIAAQDRPCFDLWWQARSQGHAAFRPRVALGASHPLTGMHGASQGEIDVALARMEARRTRVAARFDDTAWREEETGEIFVRGPLAPAPTPPPRPTRGARPTAPAASPPPGTRRPVDPDHAGAPYVRGAARPPPTAPPRPPLELRVGDLDGAPTIDLRWHQPDALVQALVDGLATGMLRLSRQAAAAWPARPIVHLHTPGGLDLRAAGRRITEQGEEVLYQLELAPGELASVQREALAG